MALKVGAGGVCAVSGRTWSQSLETHPQNYVILPEQPWLDGFRVADGVIRQFVAVPLGKGLTVEQQITGNETWGGIQLQAYPLSCCYHDFRPLHSALEARWESLTQPVRFDRLHSLFDESILYCYCPGPQGLGAGGRMKQHIIADTHGVSHWDLSKTSRCFVHLCLADDWQRLTGTPPPHRPPTPLTYSSAGLPWFDYETQSPVITGKTPLTGVKSVNELVDEKTGLGLDHNETVSPGNVVAIKPRKSDFVREF